jgi:PIN domain
VTAPKPAVIDANVLFSATIRDLLIRCHIGGIIRIHWTNRILDETFIAIQRERPGLDPARLKRTRDLMNKGARGADITDLVDEDLPIDETVAPDLKDLHVVRAAASVGADIVTWNLDDFPQRLVEPHSLTAISPDDYLTANVGDFAVLLQVIRKQASDLSKPTTTVDMLLTRFDNLGLHNFVSRLRSQA